MLDGVLMAVVSMIESAVNYSIAVVLVGFAFLGIVGAGRRLMSNYHAGGVFSRGSV